MKQATYRRHELIFKRPGGTSRGVLKTKETFFLEVTENGKTGLGECAVFRGLSYDDTPAYEEMLQWLCDHINEEKEKQLITELKEYPSIWFGYEQALLNLKHGSNLYFPSAFTNGEAFIKINGLIWMGDANFMQEQIQEKLQLGFDCIKLKIGVNWREERNILKQLRTQFPEAQLELRVDANGGFTPTEAIEVLQQLSDLGIHSIEQPIKAGQAEEMKKLCATTPTPIALDEALIGIVKNEDKIALLETIRPQYIILKPSLVGGISGTDEWINAAEDLQIGWWITSALESNVGLNAIAQYTYTKNPTLPQGLGTGALFTNNTPSPLELTGDELRMRKS